MRLVVVGGSDAGIEAAVRARDLDPAGEVTVLVADAYPNYSICGLPYLLSGAVPAPDRLAHRNLGELQELGSASRSGSRTRVRGSIPRRDEWRTGPASSRTTL